MFAENRCSAYWLFFNNSSSPNGTVVKTRTMVFGGVTVPIGILHSCQRPAKCRVARECDFRENVGLAGSSVEDVAGAFPALLPDADVDGGKRERWCFHDAAAGVADHQVNVIQQAPVGQRWKIDEDSCAGLFFCELFSAGDEITAAGIGVGVAEEDLFRKLVAARRKVRRLRGWFRERW